MMMGNELLPKRSPDEYQRLVMIKGIYHVSETALITLKTLELHIAQIGVKSQNIKNKFENSHGIKCV